MALREIHNIINTDVALNVQTITDDTTTNGNEIDLQGFGAVEFVIFTGTLTVGDFTPLIQETDTSTSYSGSVADADLTNTEASAAFTTDTDDNKITRIGYIGSKRYVRLSIVSTSTATNGAVIGAIAIKALPTYAPTAADTAA